VVGEESAIEPSAFLFQYSYGDIDARIPQLLYALTVDLLEAVAATYDYSRNLFLDDKVGARRCLPIMGAWFQAYVDGGLTQ
jgi:hypothetical protein